MLLDITITHYPEIVVNGRVVQEAGKLIEGPDAEKIAVDFVDSEAEYKDNVVYCF